MDGYKFIIPNWDMINKMIRDIAIEVTKQNFFPSIVIGISKGGIIPAVILADLLDTDIDLVGVKLYKGVDEREDAPQIFQEVSVDIYAQKVLLVDDVADTGKTMTETKKYLRNKGAGDILVCTLHFKPWSVIKPDIFVEETDAWIIYPWERKETIRDLLNRLLEEGLTINEARKKIIESGIPEELLEDGFIYNSNDK
jgi:hypoxanthine phosphoribosyltransferase